MRRWTSSSRRWSSPHIIWIANNENIYLFIQAIFIFSYSFIDISIFNICYFRRYPRSLRLPHSSESLTNDGLSYKKQTDTMTMTNLPSLTKPAAICKSFLCAEFNFWTSALASISFPFVFLSLWEKTIIKMVNKGSL